MMTEEDIKIRFVTTPEERKIIRDRLNLFTKPLEKKSVSHTLNGMCFDKPVITQGVVNRPTPIGLKLNEEVNKWKNK